MMINFSGECGCKLSNIPILAFLYHTHQCLFQSKEHTSRVFVSHVQSPPGFFLRSLRSYILMSLHQLPLFYRGFDGAMAAVPCLGGRGAISFAVAKPDRACMPPMNSSLDGIQCELKTTNIQSTKDTFR